MKISADFRDKMRVPILLGPAILIIIVLFMGGLVMGFIQSLGYFPIIGRTELSFDAYIGIFNETGFIKSVILTLWISLSSTFLSTIFGILASLVLRNEFPGKRFVNFFFQLNIPVPHLVGAIGVLLLISPTGLVSRLMYNSGLITDSSQFPIMVYDKFAIAIILEYVWKASFFMGIMILAVLQGIGEDYEDVARTLGSNMWQRFRFVILPLIMPAVLRGSILVFAFTFGSFEIPYLLGQRYPSALPVLAFRSYHDVDLNMRPEAMAMSMIIVVLISILIVLYMRLSEGVIRKD